MEDEDQFVRETVRRNWSAHHDWIYSYDVHPLLLTFIVQMLMLYRPVQVTKVWHQRVVDEDGKKGVAQLKIGDELGTNIVVDAHSITMAV